MKHQEILKALTLEQKVALLSGRYVWSTYAFPRAGIPSMVLSDGPHGLRRQLGRGDHLGQRPSQPATCFPTAACLAGSCDPALLEEVGRALDTEAAAQGVHMLLGPGMNLKRSPLGGRNFEYFSEDPLVSGKTGAAMVRGLQKNGVSACPKHFACNNQETNRAYNDSQVSQRALREIYLKGFEICIAEGKPQNIMSSYNKINGVWSHYNYDLCTTVLRGEWGYEGVVITDWWMRSSPDPDFPDLWDSAYRIRAQVDVLMPGAIDHAGTPDPSALESYRKGGLTLAELQRGACNVLRYLIRSNALKRMNA